MKDKNIIARSDKSFFLFLSLINFAGLFIAFYFIKSPSLRWFGIFYISTLIFMLVLSVVMLIILPNNVILQEQENLVVYQGMFKEKIALTDLLQVEITQLQRGEKRKKNGGIILTAKTENGGEAKINVIVKDKEQVVKKISKIIENISLSSRNEATITQDVE